MKVFVSGLVNIETTVVVRSFPIPYYPIDYPFFGINSQVSGVGCNAAKALTALGDTVELVSFTGNDEEALRIERDLERHGISGKGLRKTLRQTPVSAVLFTENGKRQVYCDLKDIQDQSLSPEDCSGWRDGAAAVLCNINFNRELIKAARRAGVLTATDVHVLSEIEDSYNRDFMENADILFLSDEKLPEAPEEFILKLAKRYQNRLIVIGMGEKGALLWEEGAKCPVTIPAYKPEKVVNTVGAGDALFASFLHYYLKGLEAKEALGRAVIFAGIKVGFNGASVGFSTEEEIESVRDKK